jgi:DNA-binding PadR family transcriptional regulator
MSDPTLLVLASLSEGDKHGYAMMEDIERFTGIRLGPGTLYGAITRLEKRGWIKPDKADDRRRPFTLTATGREYLKSQLGVLERVLKTAGVGSSTRETAPSFCRQALSASLARALRSRV